MMTFGQVASPPKLQMGSFGDQVKVLQARLIATGYPVPVNGIFDASTKIAVEAFQEDHLDQAGMPLRVDGIVGERTWWALYHPKKKAKGFLTVPPPPVGAGTGTGAQTSIALILGAIGAGLLLFWE